MSTLSISDYVTGTWSIDPVHSDVSFEVRHLGVAKVRGRFDEFEGTIITAENPLDSTVNVTIQTESVSTKNKTRDEHVHNDDFLNVAEYPAITFASTGVRHVGDNNFIIDGDLTIRNVTKQVELALELNGFGSGFDGKPLAGFSAVTEINRTDFGVTAGPVGAVVSDKVKITLEVEANRQD